MADNNSLALLNQTVYDSMPNLYEIHRIAAPELLIVDRVITPIWYIIGAIGNPLSAKIWLSKRVRRSNSSAIYVGSIAIVHTIFIFLHMWMELLQAWGFRTFNRPTLCEFFMVFIIFPQYLAPMLILGFTFERFIAICFPFLKETFCTVRRAVTLVISLTTLAFVFALCQAFVWAYDEQGGVCEIRPVAENFYMIWTWISEMLIFVAVPLTVLFINILVIREINKINKFGNSFGQDGTSSQTSTITLLSVSFYLICTLLPATIVYTIQMSIKPGNHTTLPQDWSEDSTWSSYLTYYHIRRIVEEICFSNFACYVFIYYITSSYFRSEVHKICCFAKCFTEKRTTITSDIASHHYTYVSSAGKMCPTDV